MPFYCSPPTLHIATLYLMPLDESKARHLRPTDPFRNNRGLGLAIKHSRCHRDYIACVKLAGWEDHSSRSPSPLIYETISIVAINEISLEAGISKFRRHFPLLAVSYCRDLSAYFIVHLQ